MRSRLVTALSLIALASACRQLDTATNGRPDAATREPHVDEKEHSKIPRFIQLPPNVVRDAQVVTAPARRLRLSSTIELNGQVVADPDHIALIGARAGGRVVTVLVKEGDSVKAGQTVALIASPDLVKRRAEYVAAAAKAVAERKNAVRLRSLANQRLGADQDAIGAEAGAAAIEAERDAANQAVRAMGATLATEGDPAQLRLVSPIAGQVVQRDAVPGQVVDPSHTLVTVADLSKVWFQAQLFEKDLGQIATGANAEVRLNGYPEKVFKARVARVASQVDPQAHTLSAWLAVEDPDGRMRLGLFGKARISLDQARPDEEISVPLSAVTEIGGRSVVFVRHPDGDYEVHEVTLGQSAGSEVPVLSGLGAGEEVVISGVHTLKSVELRSSMKDDE